MTDPRPDPSPLPPGYTTLGGLSPATDKRGGYPGSGDGETMRPPAPIPSGYKTRGEQGTPTPYDAGLREGFRRALEGEEPWWPIPGNPDGEYRGSRLAMGEPIHGTVEQYPATEWFKAQLRETRTTLDPVRAAALHEAVRLCGGRSWPTEAALVTDVLVVAERFEDWLNREDEQETP